MTTISDLELEVIMEAALTAPYGLLLRTNSVPHARVRFNSLRRKLRGDSGVNPYDELQFRLSPFPEGDLVVVRVKGPGTNAPDARGRRAGPTVEDLGL